MKNIENTNVKGFTEAVEGTVEDAIEKVEIQRKGLIARFKALKTWQKVLVIFLLTGTVAVSVTIIYKLINNNPDAVSDAIDTVVESGVQGVVENVVA